MAPDLFLSQAAFSVQVFCGLDIIFTGGGGGERFSPVVSTDSTELEVEPPNLARMSSSTLEPLISCSFCRPLKAASPDGSF